MTEKGPQSCINAAQVLHDPPAAHVKSRLSGRRWQLLTSCNRVSHSVTSDSVTPRTVAHQAPLSMEFSIPEWKNNGVSRHSLLQGIFPTQGLNPAVLQCRQILYHLSHQSASLLMSAEANLGFKTCCVNCP